ncbi:MAG: DeoR/GlpR family DNA-binding transcription regulator [Bacillota bacterium]|nr:DeoR/GlpR family DNA-binding transcription regulator [Bacillota bacterium]
MTATLTASQRRARICELLKEGKPLTVAALVESFGVSEMTVRRDLAHLEAESRLRRTRGGAEPLRTEEYEPLYYLRAKENAQEKRMIGKTAAGLVNDGEVIIVDVGTTLLEFVRNIGRNKQITVITNWIPNVLELVKYPNIRIVMLGGTVRDTELSLVGGMTSESLAGFNPDKAFLGIGGVSLEKGITDYNMDEIEVKRAMIRAARQTVVLADHTKIDRVAPVRIAPLSSVHILVTDSGATERQCEALQNAGVNVVVATPEQEG